MREQSIFLAALDIADLAQRADYLNRACDGDPALREEVEALLAAHNHSGEFLDVPVLKQMAASDFGGETRAEHHAEQGEINLSFLQPSSALGSLGRLGHYEVREVIGRGGCGIVLKAFDEKLERIIAIKVMAPELAATSPARKRFLREARATAAIRHENVVSIYAVEEQPLPFLVMEYIDGETLQQRLDRTGPLDVQAVLRIGRQVANGLAAAHDKGLIHRDIKPGNILLEDGTDHLKITDFGLARSADDASMTQSGVIAGTPLYMSPEQAQAQDIDHRSDLFSLGSVLYVMCSGRPPFRAATTIAVLRRVVEEQPRPIQGIIPEVPRWLVAIIAKLHAKNPAERFASAKEIGDLLARCLAELEQHSRVESSGDILPVISQPANAAQQPTQGEQSKSEKWADSGLAVPPVRPQRRRWVAAAAMILVLMTGLGMTEATGVTNLRGTVIRLFSPDGTLIVEVDDPGVSVTIDGEEMIITGAGAKEIRLRPGQYKVLASKDGKVVRQELVTVTTNGRQVVRVSKEGKQDAVTDPSSPGVSAPAQISPAAREIPPPFPTLLALRRDQIPPAALAHAGDGDPNRAPASLVAVLGEPEPMHIGRVLSLAYSPDGRWLASGSEDHTVLLRDAATGKVQRVLRGHQHHVSCVAFTPDNRILVSGDLNGTVKLWPTSEQREPTTLELGAGVKSGSLGKQIEMAVSRDGRFLAAGGSDGTVRLWKWGHWAKPVTLPVVSTGRVIGITFSPDAEILACSWVEKKPESPIGLYKTSDGTLKQTFSGPKPHGSLSFSADGKYLAAALDGDAVLWDLATSKATDLGKQAHRLCFSPVANRLAMFVNFDSRFHVYDVDSRSYVEATDAIGWARMIWSMAYSPDGKALALGDHLAAVNVYDTSNWRLIQEHVEPGHRNGNLALAISPDGRTLLSSGLDNTLRLWDLATPIKPRLIRQSNSQLLAFNPQGKTFATVGAIKPVTFWETSTAKEMTALPMKFTQMVFSPDGKMIAGQGTFFDPVVHLWDVQLGKEVHRFQFQGSGAGLAFSAGGQLLAAASYHGNIVSVWNVMTGQDAASLKCTGVRSIAFHPDGTLLASGHGDGTITIWDAATWQKQRTVRAHTGAVLSLKFTPDGNTLLSSGTDGVIQLRNPEHERAREVIPVGPVGPSLLPVTFDLDPSGQYLFASGPAPVIYVHRLPLNECAKAD